MARHVFAACSISFASSVDLSIVAVDVVPSSLAPPEVAKQLVNEEPPLKDDAPPRKYSDERCTALFVHPDDDGVPLVPRGNVLVLPTFLAKLKPRATPTEVVEAMIAMETAARERKGFIVQQQ